MFIGKNPKPTKQIKSVFWHNIFQRNSTEPAPFSTLFRLANIVEYKVCDTINYCKEKKEKQEAWFELSETLILALECTCFLQLCFAINTSLTYLNGSL